MVYPSSGPKAQPANCRPRASGSGSSSADSVEAALRQHEQLRPNSHSPGPLRCFFNALVRKKPLDCRTDTNLNRCLNLLQLTALGEWRPPVPRRAARPPIAPPV